MVTVEVRLVEAHDGFVLTGQVGCVVCGTS